MVSEEVRTRSTTWRTLVLCLTLILIASFVSNQNASILIHTLNAPSHFVTIDWPPSQVNACPETSCFLKPPFSALFPESEALASHNFMREYLKKHVVPTIQQVSGQSLPFRECSVIGGSPKSPNETHASIVDSTIVFRINTRLPEFLKAESILTGLGTRTDILMLQHISIKQIEKYLYLGYSNKTVQRARAHVGLGFRDRDPIILYRTECSRVKGCPRAWKKLIDSKVPNWLPISIVNHHHEFETMRHLNRERSGVYGLPSEKLVPTTGIVAIFAALSTCRRVNIFGFNGSSTGDGDFVNGTVGQVHSMTLERSLVRRLSRCTYGESWLCGRLKIYS